MKASLTKFQTKESANGVEASGYFLSSLRMDFGEVQRSMKNQAPDEFQVFQHISSFFLKLGHPPIG